MTSYGLGEMFVDTCAENFRLCRWGAEQRVECAQTRERGPPSAPAEICLVTPMSENICRKYVLLLLSMIKIAGNVSCCCYE